MSSFSGLRLTSISLAFFVSESMTTMSISTSPFLFQYPPTSVYSHSSQGGNFAAESGILLQFQKNGVGYTAENNEIITSYDEMIIYKSSPSLRYKIKPVGIPIIESVETDKDISLLPSDFVIIESNSNMTIKMNSDESITSNFTSN